MLMILIFHQCAATHFTTAQKRFKLLTRLNCLKGSQDSKYIAAGFSDSFVKLWKVQATKPDEPGFLMIN